ncbi:cation transporting ATPase C-terminal domain-containing protein [Nonomuraea sp. NPDC005501]|uniref:cation transporting ATPase C-terminal domain-containing protein n=1 Tax=Nonomuraea sp. NPDC005501 TaxID=3156884 RepID=UPI0033A38CCB
MPPPGTAPRRPARHGPAPRRGRRRSTWRLPAQILWINLLTHGLPGVALGGEPSVPGSMAGCSTTCRTWPSST